MNMFNIELFYLYVSSLTEPEWSTGAHPGTPLRLNLDDSTSNTEDSRLSDSIKTLLSGLAPEYCTCQTCMLPLDHSCCRERERERERERSVNLKHRQLPDWSDRHIEAVLWQFDDFLHQDQTQNEYPPCSVLLLLIRWGLITWLCL